jgi:tRNA-guanine family transglycosylase
MKGVTVSQLEDLSVPLILNNTYHLALNPGQKLLDSYENSRKLMGWKRAMLTDSGGFQMVSLAKLSTVSEGIKYQFSKKNRRRNLFVAY